MEPTPSTTLLEDAVATLESIRRAVLLDLQQPGNNGIYEEMPGEIERLRSQIEGSADEDIAESLDELELLASKASETGLERAKLDILDVISSLEAILVDPDLSENELLELVDASFDAFAGVPKTDAVPEEEPVLQLEAATEDELDLELIEVFAEESEQLLSSFEEQLNRLRSDNTNKVPMWELRRIAHTFKGAAGVVGLRTAADLAHRIESGLDNLSTLPEEKLTSLLQVLEPCLACRSRRMACRIARSGSPLEGQDKSSSFGQRWTFPVSQGQGQVRPSLRARSRVCSARAMRPEGPSKPGTCLNSARRRIPQRNRRISSSQWQAAREPPCR